MQNSSKEFALSLHFVLGSRAKPWPDLTGRTTQSQVISFWLYSDTSQSRLTLLQTYQNSVTETSNIKHWSFFHITFYTFLSFICVWISSMKLKRLYQHYVLFFLVEYCHEIKPDWCNKSPFCLNISHFEIFIWLFQRNAIDMKNKKIYYRPQTTNQDMNEPKKPADMVFFFYIWATWQWAINQDILLVSLLKAEADLWHFPHSFCNKWPLSSGKIQP